MVSKRRITALAPALASAVLALLALTGPARADDGLATLTATCAACHGPTGIGREDDDPNIAGQKRAYLEQQLAAFRSGARKSDEMQGATAGLTDAQIRALAAFYSRQEPARGTPHPTDLLTEGRAIFIARGGGAPPCAACHTGTGVGPAGEARGLMGGGGMMGGGMMGGGMMGGGMMGGGRHGMLTDPAITPRLQAQHAEYLAAQLDAFASGARRSEVMGPIAAGLTPHQREAVAAFLASLR